jgi:hypothetical protein
MWRRFQTDGGSGEIADDTRGVNGLRSFQGYLIHGLWNGGAPGDNVKRLMR